MRNLPRQGSAIWRFTVAAWRFLLVPRAFGGNPHGLDVSLTSHGLRILSAGLAIASFCVGAKHIRAVYFTIDEEERVTPLIRIALWLLQRRGVRVLVGGRRGPHSKYYHFLRQVWDGKRAFVLIDDDVIYGRGLADLLIAGAERCEHNACVRALRFQIGDGIVAQYRNWPLCVEAARGYDVFATNVGGVAVKPKFARKLIELGEAFQIHCQSADDIWFHWIAVRYRMPYTLIVSGFINPQPIPWSQGDALNSTVNIAGNDLAIINQYTPDDIHNIQQVHDASHGRAKRGHQGTC
jgi:hypothetical protein